MTSITAGFRWTSPGGEAGVGSQHTDQRGQVQLGAGAEERVLRGPFGQDAGSTYRSAPPG